MDGWAIDWADWDTKPFLFELWTVWISIGFKGWLSIDESPLELPTLLRGEAEALGDDQDDPKLGVWPNAGVDWWPIQGRRRTMAGSRD